LGAIARHPKGAKDVLMVATDGIVFRNRNPNLSISETTLGQWSEESYQNLTLFMPGVYWDDTTRNRLKDGGHPTLKSRGISGRSLAERIGEIDDAFRDCYAGRGTPVFELPINFSVISPKQALARNKWELCGAVITDGSRTINADPYMKRGPELLMEHGIIRSIAYDEGFHGLETTPYNKAFGDKELEALITEDGDVDMEFAQMLKGG